MAESYRDKLLSIGFAHRHRGTSRTTVVQREDNGRIGGTQTEHWDGRMDATARVDPVHCPVPVKLGKEHDG